MTVMGSKKEPVVISMLLRSLFSLKFQAFTIISCFARSIKLTQIQSVAMNLKQKHVVLLKCPCAEYNCETSG